MKLLKKMLWIIACLPILPIIGLPTDASGNDVGEGDVNGNEGNDDGNNDEGEEEGEEEGDNADVNDNNGQDDKNEKLPKTMQELQSLMKREKASGKRAILRALGVKSVDEALSKISANNNGDNENDNGDSEIKEANRKAENAEKKLSLIVSGCPKESVDDVLAIVNSRLDGNSDIDDFELAVEDVKKEYPAIFGIKPDNTGKNNNSQKREAKKQTLADRIAKNKTDSKQQHYFK